MKALSNRSAWTLIRLSYLLPAISGVILLVWACVPHLFFFYDGEAYETWSLFGLLANTWKTCSGLLEGKTGASVQAAYFSYTMMLFVVLSFLAMLGYAITAIPSAICSCIAFSKAPTDPDANRAKRWLRFFGPNRVIFVITNLVPLLPAFFPYILLANYRSQLGYVMKVYYVGPPAWAIALLLIAINVATFLCLLGAQAREHMDMFRLYKAK